MITITPRYQFKTDNANGLKLRERFSQIGNDITVRDVYLGLEYELRYDKCKEHPEWRLNQIEIHYSAGGVYFEYKGFCCNEFREEIKASIRDIYEGRQDIIT